MEKEALSLISDKDKEDGESWSNDSDAIAEIMVSFAKIQIRELLTDLELINTVGVDWDRNHLQIYEHSHRSDYIKIEDIKSLIKSWEAKL